MAPKLGCCEVSLCTVGSAVFAVISQKEGILAAGVQLFHS